MKKTFEAVITYKDDNLRRINIGDKELEVEGFEFSSDSPDVSLNTKEITDEYEIKFNVNMSEEVKDALLQLMDELGYESLKIERYFSTKGIDNDVEIFDRADSNSSPIISINLPYSNHVDELRDDLVYEIMRVLNNPKYHEMI